MYLEFIAITKYCAFKDFVFKKIKLNVSDVNEKFRLLNLLRVKVKITEFPLNTTNL